MDSYDMKNIKETAAKLQQYGRNGDTMLAHITPEEASLLKQMGGSGTINPRTGLPEYFIGNVIKAVAGPVLNIAGGLLGGSKAADAAKQQAEALRAAGLRASEMAQFRPIGITTGFGSSRFSVNDLGQVTDAGYTLTPELQAIRDRLLTDAGQYDPAAFAQAVQPLIGGASSLFNLGQQYLAESPEAAAQRFVNQQQALLAPSRAAQFAGLQSRNFARGTGGLGVLTGTGSAPANPAMQAYFNALAQQDLDIASRGQQAGLEQVRSAAGLFGSGGSLLAQVPALTTAGYSPLETKLGLARTTESMGQQPFLLSQDLARAQAGAGGAAGQLYMQPQLPAANAYSQYQSYSPFATAISGLGSQFGGGGFSSLFSNPNQYGGLFGGGGFTGPGSQAALARGGSEGSLTWRD